MVTADAVIHGNRSRLLSFSGEEHPIALQLGGSNPAKLAEAARIGAEFRYDEINLNVGCPSDRVQEGRFGACLMAEPELVAACVSAMRDSQPVPITVKCRIGIDDQDAEADLRRFIEVVADAGCSTFVVHARKAWLKGLSPKENREVPPLDYQRVYRLKAARPDLTVILNGGIETIEGALAHLKYVDGVMLGRATYQNPYILADVDRMIFGETTVAPTRGEALSELLAYADGHIAQGGRLSNITRHVLGLYHGQPRGRVFRRALSERGTHVSAAVDVLRDAIALAEHGTGREDRSDAA
jgi:tRNA-dihydrouridine synthase A